MQANNYNKPSAFHRFQVFTGVNADGLPQREKSVGMAYMKEGQTIITLRLWMMLNERYYLVPSKVDAAKYLIMTREPNKNPNGRNKYFWNIVGNGTVNSQAGVIGLRFDLIERLIFMSLHPEVSAQSATLPPPDFVSEVA